MDRPLVYVGEQPRAEDFLGLAKDALYAIGALARDAIGSATAVSGLAISATGPASLSANIGVGSIYLSEAADATAYGVLGTDSNTITKQGLLSAPTTVTLTAPSTSGYSQYYLVEASYSDVDGAAIVPPYYNSSNPSVPLNGAGGAGGNQNTIRYGQLNIALKAGTAAPTGSQTVPTVDSGYVPLWVILVSNGTTQITGPGTGAGQWYQHPSAPTFPTLESLKTSVVTLLTANTTFYVNNLTGSDSNNGLTASTAFATIKGAITYINTLNLGGFTATIQLANTGSAYAAPGTIYLNPTGIIVLQGNSASQSSYTVSGAGAAQSGVINVLGPGTLQMIGFTLANTSTLCGNLLVQYGAIVTLTNVTFTTSGGSSATATVQFGASLTASTGCIWSGSAYACWEAQYGGTFTMATNQTVSGSPTFTAFIVVIAGGVFTVATTSLSFSGSASGQRYSVSLNGVCNTSGGGASFFPGSTAGGTATGGQYA